MEKWLLFDLAWDAICLHRVPLICLMLVLRCSGKRLGVRKVEEEMWGKEADREGWRDVGGGEKEGERRKDMGRGRGRQEGGKEGQSYEKEWDEDLGSRSRELGGQAGPARKIVKL